MKQFLAFVFGIIAILALVACTSNEESGHSPRDAIEYYTTADITLTPAYELPDNAYEGAVLESLGEESEAWNEFTVYYKGMVLNIATASESLLVAFENIHEVDYTVVRSFRDGEQVEPRGDRVAIWASKSLFQLELLNFGNDMLDDEFIFIPISTHETISELHPGHLYVVNNYTGLGTLPWSGFTFLDELGVRHYFAIQHDQSDSAHIFWMQPFENRTAELPDDWHPWWYAE